MRAAYTQHLSPEERAAGLRAGASLMVKRAAWPSVTAAGMNIAKAIATTALLTGIPLGVAAHLIGRHVSSDRLKERELKERIRFFREATSGIERGLGGSAT